MGRSDRSGRSEHLGELGDGREVAMDLRPALQNGLRGIDRPGRHPDEVPDRHPQAYGCFSGVVRTQDRAAADYLDRPPTRGAAGGGALELVGDAAFEAVRDVGIEAAGERGEHCPLHPGQGKESFEPAVLGDACELHEEPRRHVAVMLGPDERKPGSAGVIVTLLVVTDQMSELADEMSELATSLRDTAERLRSRGLEPQAALEAIDECARLASRTARISAAMDERARAAVEPLPDLPGQLP